MSANTPENFEITRDLIKEDLHEQRQEARKKALRIEQFLLENAQELSGFITDTSAPKNTSAENPSEESWETRKKSSMRYTIPLLAQFEDIRTRAYDDGYGYMTIGIGSTVCPDGSPVKRGMTITSQEELNEFTQTHIEKRIYPCMEKYLPVESLSEQEIAAITSLCYNCGAGVLGKDGKPSLFSQNFKKWKETGERKYLDNAMTLMKQKCTVRGKKNNALANRRDFEARILTGDMQLGHAPCEPPVIDLTEIAIGSVNTIGYGRRLPRTEELIPAVRACPGDTIQDKLDKATIQFEQQKAPRKKISRTAAPSR